MVAVAVLVMVVVLILSWFVYKSVDSEIEWSAWLRNGTSFSLYGMLNVSHVEIMVRRCV